MVQVCRVCEKTLVLGKDCIDFSTAVADIGNLATQCVELETDLHDAFNAFCFKCRNITMSVPGGCSTNQQVCYLRSQVNHFESMKSLQLVVHSKRDNS